MKYIIFILFISLFCLCNITSSNYDNMYFIVKKRCPNAKCYKLDNYYFLAQTDSSILLFNFAGIDNKLIDITLLSEYISGDIK